MGVFGGDLLAVVLTGMGSDGLTGAGAVIAAGAGSRVQDEASSLVRGRPGAVAKAGLAQQVLPLDKIGGPVAAEVRHSRRDCVPAAWGATIWRLSLPGGRQAAVVIPPDESR